MGLYNLIAHFFLASDLGIFDFTFGGGCIFSTCRDVASNHQPASGTQVSAM